MINYLKNRFQLSDSGASEIIRAIVSGALLAASNMIPMIIIMLFTQGLLEGGLPSLQTFIILICGGALVMFVLYYVNYNDTYTVVYSEAKTLRINLAEKLKELPLSFFSKHDMSDLAQAIMKDITDIEHALSHAIPKFYSNLIAFVLISVLLLVWNVPLGLSIIIPTILSFAFLYLSKSIQIRETNKYFVKLRENAEKFQQAIELQQEIKSYRLEEATRKDVAASIEDSEKIHIRAEFSQAVPVTLSGFIARSMLGVTIFVGSILYANDGVTLLYLLGYILASSRISEAILDIQMNFAEMLYIDSRIKNIRSINETAIQSGESAEIRDTAIEFKDVTFAYDDNHVINGVSFTAPAGKVTALVGPSGCGKTTALRLASRLYDYDQGEIRIDGRDMKNIATEDLFKKISIVFQDVTLFNTTVLENIRIGRPDASDEEVKKAARLANCDEFVGNLPDGYDTIIGENGGKLSGGERQRLSIARAILKNSPIILLDEISAALDIENEKKIQDSLNSLIKGRTVIIISHRMKSIENADTIVVMKDGRVEALGKHAHLMKNSPTYRDMIEKSQLTDAFTY